MFRFWHRYSAPLIREVAPARIVEIGADLAYNTWLLLVYCHETGAFLDIVDTVPSPDLIDAVAGYGPTEYALHVGKSVELIARIPTCDLVMLDGDHNWQTVHTELSLLWEHAQRSGQTPPIVLAHDCAWPYARRDMYYNPLEFTAAERHPYAYKGMLPGRSELADDGMNGHLANALHEGGPRNGVLTAIEDFIAEHEGLRLWTLPFHNGLAIIVPQERLTERLHALIESFYSRETMLAACQEVEASGMKVRAEMLADRKTLEQKTKARARARGLIEAQKREIGLLEADLHAKSWWARLTAR